jgi:hypothetical protein
MQLAIDLAQDFSILMLAFAVIFLSRGRRA